MNRNQTDELKGFMVIMTLIYKISSAHKVKFKTVYLV